MNKNEIMKAYQGIYWFCFLIILTFSFTSCNKVNQEKFTYTNPVIPGDFPDPSIIRVGEMYYACGTSCDFAPIYPIYESNDLVNWTRIGSVFDSPPEWASEDFWAPELLYRNGTFYVYYTAKRKNTRIACIGVASSSDIYKGFTDNGIIIEWGEEAIDAYVFKDDDGKLYITWKAYGLTEDKPIEILASELSVDGLSLAGEYFTLTDHAKGWQGAGDEGQCLIKHDDYYYLFYSIGGCCDNKCDYRVMVARSKNLRSGWEQYSKNPILKGGDEWVCPGHGTLFSTADNRFYYLYHAYNIIDFEFIGRQGMIDEVEWNDQTAWPYFKNGESPSALAPLPFKNKYQKRDSVWMDNFSSDKYLAFYEWDLNTPKPEYTLNKGELCIRSNYQGINFLGIRPKTGDYMLSSEVIITSEMSGIGIYSNEKNVLAFTADNSRLLLFQIKNGDKEVLFTKNIEKKKSLHLKYEATAGQYYSFFWSGNGIDWVPVILKDSEKVDGTFIAQWGYSPRVGFIIQGDNKTQHRFSELNIHNNF